MDTDTEYRIRTVKDIYNIKPDMPDHDIYVGVKERWDHIAKPIDGLGDFEDILCRMAAIAGDDALDSIDRSLLIIMCADNGVVAEGVTQTGQEATAAVAKQMGLHRSSVCRMADLNDTDIRVYDMGMNTDTCYKGVDASYKQRRGTRDLFIEPAMTEEETLRCIHAGMDIVRRAKAEGYGLLALGEMGIGNTTTSACVTAGLSGLCAADVTGRGAGLSDEGFARKLAVVQSAIDGYGLHKLPPIEVLRTVGGYDIAGLAGVCIGAAICHMPVILDGYITEAAALVAERSVPGVREYMIASHSGSEKGIRYIEKALGLKPVIYARLKLGEGTGGMMLISLIRQALAVYRQVYDFDDIALAGYERYGGKA